MKNQFGLCGFLLLSSSISLISCSGGSSSSSSSASFKPPKVAPVVNAALPAAYQASNVTVSSVSRPIKKGTPGVSYLSEYHRTFGGRNTAYPTERYSPRTTVTVTNSNSTLAQTNIGYLFTNSFNDINNGSVEWQGYVNNQIIQIDERMTDGVMNSSMLASRIRLSRRPWLWVLSIR